MNRRQHSNCSDLRSSTLHEGREIGLPSLADQIGFGDANALGRYLVVRGIVGREFRINAGQQQAGVRLAADRRCRIAGAGCEWHRA